jgi:multidrug efflux system membrane fusion protein
MLSPTADLDRRAPSGESAAPPRAARRKPRKVLWTSIVAVLMLVLLGALYGFNQFRAHMIASFFAGNKPPPAQVSVAVAALEQVPRYANGIGSLAAVRQVTVTPEAPGRITQLHFEPGARVESGAPLVQLNDEPEKAELLSLQAQARFAELALQRSRSLVQTQAVAQQTLDQNQSNLDQVKANIARTQAIIAQKFIRAPFAGVLGIRQVNLGQYVNIGTPVVTLTDLSSLHVNFTLPSQMRAQIAVGQSVKVTTDALPGRTFEAKITAIEPQVSAETRTMQVQATMTNPDGVLLSGMFVNAAVVLPAQPDSVVLPDTAIDYTLYGDSVFVVRDDGADDKGQSILKAFRTPVKTGARWEDKVEVTEGLKSGDRVVAVGQLKLQNGGAVAISDTPAPAAPAKPTLH